MTVERKKRRSPIRGGRLMLLLLAAGLLLAVLLLTWRLSQPEPASPKAVSTVETLFAYDAEEVTALHVDIRGEASWAVALDAETGRMLLDGEEGFLLSEAATRALQEAAAVIICEQIVSTDPAEYRDHLSDYGLDDPGYTAEITFSDGTSRTLRVGSRAPHTAAWYYMLLDGDDRLFALSSGMVENLFVSRESLWDVVQPVIHRDRIDRLTLTKGDGVVLAEWAMQGAIDEDDAAEQWHLTAPFSYPADATAMSSLLQNAANLRLGAYVAPATPENLAAYGFTQPRLTIAIHMAEGAMGATGLDGAYSISDWPESTVTFVIGGERNDLVDYVLYEGCIYVSSHFTMGVFLDIDPRNTMNRYPVLTALGNLASLAVTENGETVLYELTRTEQVAPNNELVYDEEGNLVYDLTVTRNGEVCDAAAFEAAYQQLVGVRVGGVIPEGETASGEAHTVFAFTDVNGTVNTVALVSYGVAHDAVSVNGHQAFYLAKGAFRLGLE